MQKTTDLPSLIAELKACGNSRNLQKGKIIHNEAIQTGYDSNVFVTSTVIHMYAKCGSMEDAHKVFDKMDSPDVVCWTALISGYAENGDAQMALDLFSRMEHEGCPPNERSFLAALKACTGNASCKRQRGKVIHLLAMCYGVDLDVYVQSTLIDMYSKCENMDCASSIFEKMLHRTVVSWNAIVLGYAENGEGMIALEFFSRMFREGCVPDTITFVAAFKACTDLAKEDRLQSKRKGQVICMLASSFGCDCDIYVQSTLVDFFAKCGRMKDARATFDNMLCHHVVSWTALILGYVENGEDEVALELFSGMYGKGYVPNERTCVAVLKACSNLATTDMIRFREKGRVIHLLASNFGWDLEKYVENALIDMYGECESMDDARRVFNKCSYRDVVLWTSLILGYAENGEGEIALDLFSNMDCTPNSRTFVAVLKACTHLATNKEGLAKIRSKERGRAAHLLASSVNFDSEIYVQTTLVDMYAKCGNMEDSCKLFNKMLHHNVVCWNALILGYADNGEGRMALTMFSKMSREGCAADTRTFVAVLKACTVLALKGMEHLAKEWGKVLHVLASSSGCDSDTYVKCTLIDMYGKCRSMEDACMVFDGIENRDVVSWNALLLGYVDSGKGAIVLNLYTRMKSEACEPNVFTFAAVLKASGMLGALEFGKRVHEEIRSGGFEKDTILATCLVDFYVKCGSLIEAEKVFEMQTTWDLVTWTALMVGYSRNGDTGAVFRLFKKMPDAGLQPDGVTFSCILTACSHAGLLDEGMLYFEEMTSRFGINPDIEHYTCMLDMLGRGNKLEDVMALLRSMPHQANVVTWMTVLGACQKWKSDKLGLLAFESLTCLDDRNSGAYVTIANIYGSSKMVKSRAV